MQEVRETRECAPWETGDPAPDHVFGSSLGQELIAEVPAGAAGLRRWLARSCWCNERQQVGLGGGCSGSLPAGWERPSAGSHDDPETQGAPLPEVGQSFPQNSLEGYWGRAWHFCPFKHVCHLHLKIERSS